MGRIRCAATEDLDAVTALEARCFPPAEAATREDFARRLRAYPNHFWILEQEGQVIAFVNGMVTDEKDLRDEMYGNAELHNEQGAWQMIFGVDTHPEFRRQGCASRLLRHVIETARAQGRRGLVLTCKEELLPFYGRLGFQSEGVSESDHGGVTWYQMRLTLEKQEVGESNG